jgi:outer membrane protein with beta-barrel domain
MKAHSSLVPAFFVLLMCLAGAHTAYGQADRQRLEVGGQLATLHLSDSESTTAGFGGRVSYDFTPWLAADGEMNVFGNDSFERLAVPDAIPGARLAYSRRRLDGFLGAKVGLRGSRFGVFGKVRPGFTRLFDKGIDCAGDVCALILLARPQYRTEFALDLGGVLEFYPTARTVTRLDLGSTLIRHRSNAVPPCADCTTRNFSSRIGVGFRF